MWVIYLLNYRKIIHYLYLAKTVARIKYLLNAGAIKYGGSKLKQRLYSLILLICKKEELPKDWMEGIICSVYKKGDCTECSNYRPITLLNIAYKIFSILLNNQLSEIVQGKLSNVQMGFRPDRSTVVIYLLLYKFFKNVTVQY
jgi:sorting nexin-29